MSNMSANSSSSDFDCFTSNIGISMSIFFLTPKMIIILVLSILVLHEGYQQWQQGSLATASHSDVFTYNMIVLELIFILAIAVTSFGTYANQTMVTLTRRLTIAFVYPGEISFNIVTCVERHLAVVHPITYLGLRQSGGLRIRNICIVCVWLMCFVWLGIAALYYPAVPYIPYLCVMAVSLIIVSFCSLSVLCVLIRPGPGETGADRKKVDQSKQKAFYTITAIMVVLLVSFLGLFFTVGLVDSYQLGNTDKCIILLSSNWFGLPISLVLPLLFLQRRGKLSCSFSSKK